MNCNSPEIASCTVKSKKLTDIDIREILINSDEEYNTKPSSSDESDGEGLLPNLETLGNPEAEGPSGDGERGMKWKR